MTDLVRADVIEFTVPGLRIESEMNLRGHWSVRANRFKKQRTAVHYAMRRACPPGTLIPLPSTVTITRIAPRPITDGDNVQSGAKAVRDAIAAYVGIDDGSPCFRWKYEQERGKPKQYAVRIRIESIGEKAGG